MKTAGGIDDEHIAAVVACLLDRFERGLHRILRTFFIDHGTDLFTDHLQLLDGSGAVDVAGGKHDFLSLLLQVTGQLGGHGGFAGALQTAEHVNGRDRGRPGQLRQVCAHGRSQLFADNLHDLLGRGKGTEHFLSDTFLGDALDKVFGDGVVDICFKERHADLAHAFLDILL